MKPGVERVGSVQDVDLPQQVGRRYPAATVNIARPNTDDFTGTSSGEQLQLNHCPDLPADERLEGVDQLWRYRFDRFGLASFATAASQTSDGLK